MPKERSRSYHGSVLLLLILPMLPSRLHPQHVLVLCCASHTDTAWASAYLTALGFSLLPTTDVVEWILALKRLARLSPTNQRSIAPVFSPTCVREISTSRRLHDDLFSRLSQSASRSLKCRCPALPSVVPSSARCPGMDSQSCQLAFKSVCYPRIRTPDPGGGFRETGRRWLDSPQVVSL